MSTFTFARRRVPDHHGGRHRGSGLQGRGPAAALTAVTATLLSTGALELRPTTGHAADNTAIQFDGSSQYVTFGVAAGSGPDGLGASSFTVETWFQWTGTGATTVTGATSTSLTSVIPLVAKGRGEDDGFNVDANYFLGIQGGKIAADYEEGAGQLSPGANHALIGATTVTTGVWHHAAVTLDSASGAMSIFLDGVQDATQVVGANRGPRSDSIQHASVGTAIDSTGTADGFFAGQIDEVRIWNVPRSQEEIQAAMDTGITLPQTGLIGAWKLDDGGGTAAAALTGPNGTLTGGPTWVAGFVPPVPTFPPDLPIVAAPADAASDVSRTPVLDVIASDPDGGTVDVSFFGRPLASGRYAHIGTAIGVTSGGHATMPWPDLGGGQTYQWYATVSDGAQSTTGATSTFHTVLGAGTVLLGVGDTASCASPGDEATAAVMAGLDGPIFTTGDNVYDTGTAAEFANCYDPSWGTFRARTRPVPGNHDWGDVSPGGSLAGYFGYFGANANAPGPSYYSYDVDANWHVVSLDSECGNVAGGCAAGSPQHSWLVADLAANAGKNVIAIWHRPLFGSGTTSAGMQPMVDVMYAAGVDLAVVGHDHVYERLQPLSAQGTVDPVYGIRTFTIGTGGAEYHLAGAPVPGSVVLNDDTWGVMKFVLYPTSYDWQFLPVDGATFTDAGSGTVHGVPAPGDNGLDLGADGAYVDLGDPAKLDLTAFTVETWFKRTGAGVATTSGGGGVATFIPLVTHGGPESDGSDVDANWLLGIDDSTDVLAADFEDIATGGNHPVLGTTPITDNTWHHAAATYDGTTWRLYLDGQLEVTKVENATPRNDSRQHAALGAMLTSAGVPEYGARFQGVLDEVRVWSGARSLEQIQTTMNSELTSGPGLVARWGFSEGTGTTVADSMATPANGTVVGTGTSRPAGAPFGVPLVDAGPDQMVTLPDDALLTGAASDDGIPAALITTWTQESGPGVAVISDPSSLATSVSVAASGAGVYVFRLTASDAANTVIDEVQVTVDDPSIESSSGLHFDGVDDYVTFLDDDDLDLAQFTIETWFRRDGPGTPASTGWGGVSAIPLVTKGRGEEDGTSLDMNYFLGIDAGTDKLVADFEEGSGGASPGLNHPIRGNTVIQNGVWYHAAATYDGTTWRLYLDGVPDGTLNIGQPVRSNSIQHAGLATAIDSTGTPSGHFDGALDEVRIWNSARSGTQIEAARSTPLPSAAGMVARWGADERAGTVLSSSAGPLVDGTLTGGVLWGPGAPFAPPINQMPNAPVNLTPIDGATGVIAGPTLGSRVTDPDGGQLTTSFYGRQVGSNGGFALIGSVATASGATASIQWPGLTGGTAYEWYADTNDGAASQAGPTSTFTVTNTNREPTFDQDLTDRSDPEGAAVSLEAHATDLDGDPLAYAASGLPPGLSIDTATGLITGTIGFTAAAGSPYVVSVTIRDGAAVDATDVFTWTVTNTNREPAFAQNLLDRSDPEGTIAFVAAGATDADGDALTYAATGLPPGLSMNTLTGAITGTISAGAAANSPYDVSVTVRDGAAIDATDSFGWTVTAPSPGISFRGAASGTNTVGSRSMMTVSRPDGVAAGDVMLASIDLVNRATISAPAGWTLVQTTTQSKGSNKSTYVKVAGADEPSSYTWSFTASRQATGGIHAYAGVDTADPILASAGATMRSTSVKTPSVTTTVPNALVVGFFSTGANATWSPPAGMAERHEVIGVVSSSYVSSTGSDKIQAAAGATGTLTAVASRSGRAIAQVIALRPAG
jgi:hypothetical protein